MINDKRVDGVEKAVAIKYAQDLPAPFILAKGKGALADRIKRIAQECGISLVAVPELTDALVEMEVGSLIPEEFYQIVAELLVFVRRQVGRTQKKEP